MRNSSRLRIAGCLLAIAGTFLVGGGTMELASQGRNKQYEGFILIQPGLESRVFKSDLDQREFYWVDYGPEVDTKTIREKMKKLEEFTLAVWVQVEGEIESGGHLGHLGQYEKRLLVRKVIKCSSEPVEQYRASRSMISNRVTFSAEEIKRIACPRGGEAPFWTPTDDQVKELESLLPGYLKSRPPIDDKPVENVLEYGRQYFGVTKKGLRLIYLNAFCNPSKFDPRWKKEIVLVNDGGSCYFQVFFDPAKKEFIDLHYNGQA